MARSTATPTNVVTVRRPRRVTPLADIEKAAHEYIAAWRAAKVAGNTRDKVNKTIKAWFAAAKFAGHDVAVNENGSQILTFPEPILIDGRKYLGLENRRTVRSELDLDLVDGWLDTLSAAKRAELRRKLYKKVVTEEFQPDELFALQQEGVLTEDQLDELFTISESFALCVTED